MGSTLGAMKTAATRVGLTLKEYQDKQSQGLRWCCGCKLWHSFHQFSTDNTRTGGRARTCREWRNRNIKKVKASPEKLRARSYVHWLVRSGKIPHPSALPCSKCGRPQQELGKRHEYHHHNGYGQEHKADVIAMCSTCHSQEDK